MTTITGRSGRTRIQAQRNRNAATTVATAMLSRRLDHDDGVLFMILLWELAAPAMADHYRTRPSAECRGRPTALRPSVACRSRQARTAAGA